MNKCALCEKGDCKLLACSRCRLISYCSRECQARDWKEHRPQCGAFEDLLAMGNCDQEKERKTVEKSVKLCNKKRKQAVKAGEKLVCVSLTAFGIVGPGMPIPDGVPPNFALKQQAVMEFQQGPSRSGNGLGNFVGEQHFRAYYDDIVDSTSEWMTFFKHPENVEHAEHTCGILGTLATIYRQRGTLEICEEVLDMEDRVLQVYKQHCLAQQSNTGMRRCFETLEFKCNHIRYNLCFAQKRYDENVRLYRLLMDYELRHNLPFEDQLYLFMITAVLHKKPTAKVLYQLTDADIRKLIQAALTQPGDLGADAQAAKVALQKCKQCQAVETALAQFKSCSRCKQVYYCGRDCQKGHWKKHKKKCMSMAASN